MPRKVTQYVEPEGWRHVQATYDNITSKLDELPLDQDLRVKAIDYWMKRLKEDREAIKNGEQARVSPSGS